MIIGWNDGTLDRWNGIHSSIHSGSRFVNHVVVDVFLIVVVTCEYSRAVFTGMM
jgi:hypothetical protein